VITQELMPLTLPQQGFVETLEANSELRASFSMSISITGTLDVAALLTSLHRLVSKNDALRIAMRRTDTASWGQWFRDTPPLSEVTKCQRVHAVSDIKFSKYVVGMATRDAATPWNLEEDYPYRFRLIRRSEKDHVLLLTFAKQAVDGAVCMILPRELWSSYHALLAGESASSEPGTRFAEALRHRAAKDAAEPSEFWRSRLTRAQPSRFPLPNVPVEPDRRLAPRTFAFSLAGEEVQVLRREASRARRSELQLIQAVLAEAVFEQVPDDTLAITIPVDTRRSRERDVLGQFAMNLPLVLNRPANGDDIISQVRNEWFQVLQNRHITSRTVQHLAPMSTGWLGSYKANNLRLNYLQHMPPISSGRQGHGALCIAYDRYPPRTLSESAAVHLRVGSSAGQIDFTLSCDEHTVSGEVAEALADSLQVLIRRRSGLPMQGMDTTGAAAPIKSPGEPCAQG
jgi:hypothetical protein